MSLRLEWCPTCQGDGELGLNAAPCPTCHGKGYLETQVLAPAPVRVKRHYRKRGKKRA